MAALKLQVITPVFMEDKPGGPKVVSFHAKRARGAMARFIIQRRLMDPAGVLEFDTGGYAYRADLSEPHKPVFLRAPITQAPPDSISRGILWKIQDFPGNHVFLGNPIHFLEKQMIPMKKPWFQ